MVLHFSLCASVIIIVNHYESSFNDVEENVYKRTYFVGV